MIHSYPVIITANKKKDWHEGIGQLYEPFEETDYFMYSILHIMASSNIAHGQTGYYILLTAKIQEAEHHGLILTDAQGDRYGFRIPNDPPCASLEDAILTIQKNIGITLSRIAETIASATKEKSTHL